MMRSFSKMACGVFALCFFLSSNAHAQSCSAAQAAGMNSCVTDSVYACKAEFAACNSLSSGLTIEDVTDIAVERCCFKSKRAQRRACLIVERRKYVSRPASGDQKAFFQAARAAITELRAGDCNSNAYASGF